MKERGKPRNRCKEYIDRQGTEPVLLSKRDFDELVLRSQFGDGPYRDTFGDGHGEPYNPHRQAFGTLKDNRVVFCELHPDVRGEVEEILNL